MTADYLSHRPRQAFPDTSEKNGWDHNRKIKDGSNHGTKALAKCDNSSGADVEFQQRSEDT
jgi:hypothetical protein